MLLKIASQTIPTIEADTVGDIVPLATTFGQLDNFRLGKQSSADGKTVLIYGLPSLLWNLETLEQTPLPDGLPLAISHSGRYIVLSTEDSTQLWDTQTSTGHETAPTQYHGHFV